MSISYTLGSSSTVDFIEIGAEMTSAKVVRCTIAKRLKVLDDQITLMNVSTNTQYPLTSTIFKGSILRIERNTPPKFHHIIHTPQLQHLMSDCRFFMMKSSNEQNVQKAKECSLWATTHSNQERLKAALRTYKHVLLFFANNRSYELKGLARMEADPDKTPDKTIWIGVNNIRLGGNFKIKWIRKKPLSLVQIEKTHGAALKEDVLRLCDGQEVDDSVGKKIAVMFEVPAQPYYQEEHTNLVQEKKIVIHPVNNYYFTPAQLIINSHIASISIDKPKPKQDKNITSRSSSRSLSGSSRSESRSMSRSSESESGESGSRSRSRSRRNRRSSKRRNKRSKEMNKHSKHSGRHIGRHDKYSTKHSSKHSQCRSKDRSKHKRRHH